MDFKLKFELSSKTLQIYTLLIYELKLSLQNQYIFWLALNYLR